jgi:hypothetical protein
MRSLAQLMATAFTVGLLLGAWVTRMGRFALVRFSTSAAVGAVELLPLWKQGGALPAAASNAPPLPPSPPAPLPPLPPLPAATSGSEDDSDFLVIEDSVGLPRYAEYDFGACRTSQQMSLDHEGFAQEDAGGGPHRRRRRGCAVAGLNGTLLVLTPMHNRVHTSNGELAIDRYFRLLRTLSYPRCACLASIGGCGCVVLCARGDRLQPIACQHMLLTSMRCPTRNRYTRRDLWW